MHVGTGQSHAETDVVDLTLGIGLEVVNQGIDIEIGLGLVALRFVNLGQGQAGIDILRITLEQRRNGFVVAAPHPEQDAQQAVGPLVLRLLLQCAPKVLLHQVKIFFGALAGLEDHLRFLNVGIGVPFVVVRIG